jgi:hypothetical protein
LIAVVHVAFRDGLLVVVCGSFGVGAH